ncbi:hypothetical protein [Nocardia sp. CA-135398]|uniref:hypothetical protein n=1 Tax=Nocardia sp. CA-135398 TaxID=3239977 RepID=UPI003D98F314
MRGRFGHVVDGQIEFEAAKGDAAANGADVLERTGLLTAGGPALDPPEDAVSSTNGARSRTAGFA